MATTKAVAYARVSTTEQAQGMSLDAQLRAIRAYAAQRGLSLVGEYIDPGSTGTSDDRPEFRRMVESLLSPSNDVSVLVVLHTSRFMRDVELARRYKRALRQRGVRVLAVQQEVADDANGELMEGIYELFDQHESRIIGMRCRAGMKENVRRGFFNGSFAPFGFKVIKVDGPGGRRKSKLAADDVERRVVRDIFERYVGGNGAETVARELNQQASLYRGKRWTRDLVLRVLDDRAVMGRYEWGGKSGEAPVSTVVPPIISEDTFDVAQRIRRRRDPLQGASRTRTSTQLLGGLLVCGKCGARYQLETSGKRDGKGAPKYRYYNCRAFCRSGREVCPGYRIRTRTLDSAVLRHLSDELFTEGRCRALLDATIAGQTELNRERVVRRHAVEAEVAEIEDRIQRWCNAFETGGELADLGVDRLRDLREQQAALRRVLEKVQPLPPMPPFLYKPAVVKRFQERVRAALDGGDQKLARAYLGRLVESITITDGDVLVQGKVGGTIELMAERGKSLVTERARSRKRKVRTHVVHWYARQDSRRVMRAMPASGGPRL